MKRRLFLACLVLAAASAIESVGARQAALRTLDDKFPPPRLTTLDAWNTRADYLRAHVLASAGLLPLPEKTALRPVVFGEVTRADYRVSKVYFESVPGFFVTGNLYRPIGDGPFPAVLSPHGHWTYGRLENTPTASGPARAVGLARQGFVVFSYDMIGYNDSQQLPHTFGGRRESLWGLSLAGLQLWNSIRALDFLETLPYVRRDALAATGESGGGTQTFLLAAVDSRVKVAVPVNMISLHMQGGCLCENPPGLRLATTNVEIAATIAPRPLLMVSATGDWTKETLEVEYPAVRAVYELYGAADRVQAVRMTAEHNYNKDSREAMYAWMARWLQGAPADVIVPERSFAVEPLPDLLVFQQRALPEGAVTAAQLTDAWIAAAKQQLRAAPSADAGGGAATRAGVRTEWPRVAPAFDRTVLVAHSDPAVGQALASAGFEVRPIGFPPFDEAAAAKVRHFETYNRTAASRRVEDGRHGGEREPRGRRSSPTATPRWQRCSRRRLCPCRSPFSTSGNSIRRATRAISSGSTFRGSAAQAICRRRSRLARGKLVIHNAGDRFAVTGVDTRPARLTPAEIVGLLRR